MRPNGHIKEKWGDSIRKVINSFFDNGTFLTSEMTFTTDDIIPVKLSLKAKLNVHGGLDKIKARICVRGDMQIKVKSNPWSPSMSSRFLRCFIAKVISHKAIAYQLYFLHAFIQLEQRGNFGRFMRLKRCIYGVNLSGKSWYGT